jgi:hypothetical protein
MRPLLVETVTESKIRGARPGFPGHTLFLVLFSDRMPRVSMIDGAELQGRSEHRALLRCLKHMHLDCSVAMHHKLPNSAVFFRSLAFSRFSFSLFFFRFPVTLLSPYLSFLSFSFPVVSFPPF